MTHLDRWRSHRQTIEINFFGGQPPQVSHGEFLILAAVEMMMATLDDVLAKVAEEKTIEQSLSVLLDGYNDALKALTDQVAELQAELAAAGQDTTKIDAIMASLDDNESVLNAARAKIIPAVLQPGPDTTGGTDTSTGTVASGQGDDTISSGQGTDTIVAPAGDDTLSGGQGDDSVTGAGTTTDTLIGGRGDDSLAGAAGDDTVTG